MDELDLLTEDWQDTVDLMAQIIDVPAGLIMRLTEGNLEVFIASNTKKNPYKVGNKEELEGSGLYCENVIKTNRKLKVPNALNDKIWKSNPDIKLNMISYLGYPISWPNGELFGTICVLDEKENFYSIQYEHLVLKFRNLIEHQLAVLEKNKQLTKLAEIDSLTNILNRRTLLLKAEVDFERALRYNRPFSVIMFDIDHFKNINDAYGHQSGDHILKHFAGFIQSLLRTSDIWGRYGGEEFMAVLGETGEKDARSAAERFRQLVADLIIEYNDNEIKFTFSAGVAAFDGETDLATVISKADKALYEAKADGRNCVR